MPTVEGKAYWASVTRPNTTFDQIGRASCRERVQISVVAVSLKKKKTNKTKKNKKKKK